MTRIRIPNSYPIEVMPPDIAAHAAGNTGIPYVWSFDSGRPGPHAMISAIVHGNEPCGAVALDWLLGRETRPGIGRLTLVFANVAAYEQFDPSDPYASRWVDQDFNRLWSPEVLDGDADGVELRRARELRPLLGDVDRLLDLHSMQHPAPPLALSGWLPKGAALARDIGIPPRVVADRGHAAGPRMRDHGPFADPGSHAAAVLVECGQHWAGASAALAREVAARFLVALGMVGADILDEIGAASAPHPQQFFEVCEAVTVESDDFHFVRRFTGGEVIAEAGTLLAHDGRREIRTPCDDCMLVMPSRRLWPGQTAVRLARAVPPPD